MFCVQEYIASINPGKKKHKKCNLSEKVLRELLLRSIF